MSKLEIGHNAPNFALVDQDGKTVQLGDFRGRKLLVYFYPMADTPGCTRQSCVVRDALPDLKSLGVDAVGISPDRSERQKGFDKRHHLGFPLLADEDKSVARAYGALGEKKMFGKTREGIIRSAFLVGEQGQIMAAFYNVKPDDTVSRARTVLGG